MIVYTMLSIRQQILLVMMITLVASMIILIVYSIQHIVYNIQYTTYSIQNTAYDYFIRRSILYQKRCTILEEGYYIRRDNIIILHEQLQQQYLRSTYRDKKNRCNNAILYIIYYEYIIYNSMDMINATNIKYIYAYLAIY